MSAPSSDLQQTRAAVDDFLAAAERCTDCWAVPVRPGKWSPAQIVEHIARALEAGARDMQGERSNLPALPPGIRFLARTLVFDRSVRNAALPKARTNPAMNPKDGPTDVAAARDRIEAAWRTFEEARNRTGSEAASRTFGRVPLDAYLRFQELHIRHHTAQFPQA